MMKPIDAPRRVYTRKGIPFVNFLGSFWAPLDNVVSSAVDVRCPVTCVELEEGLRTGKGVKRVITVTQRKPHARKVTETWVRLAKLR